MIKERITMPKVPKRQLSYGELLDQKRIKKNKITMGYPKKKVKQKTQ